MASYIKCKRIDNKREYIYSKQAQPYVIKVYECEAKGIVMVCEYLTVFSLDDFYSNQREMRKICKELSDIFFIGDIGINTKNYYNWGYKEDGSIAILDFAYIYLQSFKTVSCPCGSLELLSYDSDYNLLICPTCGQKHSFWTLRKRITKEQQANEIGDIQQKGYVITDYKIDDVQILNPKFTDLPKEYRKKEDKPKKMKPKRKGDGFDSKEFLKSVNEMIDSGEC